MNTSDAGLAFILGWEGSRAAPYDDGGPGIGNCTIGVGHLIHYGPCTPAELSQAPLGDDQITALLRQDVSRFEDVVNASARVALNQNQFDALVDFCFNTGGYYPEVWATVNAGGDVCAVLVRTAVTPEWARAALTRRRQAECALYNTPVPVEEDNDMPFLVWVPQQAATYLVGPQGARYISSQQTASELEKNFGPITKALSVDELNAIGVVQ